MPTNPILTLAVLLISASSHLTAADRVFSGPQPGEKATSFLVTGVTGTAEAQPRDPIISAADRPLALVFLHGIERSLVPLIRVIDEYGALRKDRLNTEILFLSADRIAGEQRLKAASSSLKLKSPVSLSLDGVEGPGNYGLNKECLMTILAITNSRVAANFALVQPGIADAPQVLEALARICGDTNPPTVAELSDRGRAPNGGGERAGRMKSEDGASTNRTTESFPGAVPTDAKLQGLLRGFIRKTNDVATVDRILADVKSHIQGNGDLQKQAIDGWVRILHFGDRYGTDYAREKGQEFLAGLQRQTKP